MPARAAPISMPLVNLLAGIVPGRFPDVRISDLTLDSRSILPGSLFLACRGLRHHGIDFLDAARRSGAAAVLWESDLAVAKPRAAADEHVYEVPNLARLIGALADRFFGSPSAALSVTGVTGTNGKTTTAFLIAQALEACGEPSAYAGTIGFGRPKSLRGTSHTTPDCVSVHRELADAHGMALKNVAMEVSSHALDQGRVDAVRFRTAVFTNLTRDHLDYHGTMDAYGSAKSKLFETPELEARVINVCDPFGLDLAGRKHPGALLAVATRSMEPRAEQYVIARHVRTMPRGLDLDVETHLGVANFPAPLVGPFNAENILLTLGTLLSRGFALDQATRALANVCAPAGRMEMFHRQGRAVAVVDYAHSPDALAKALEALREHSAGRLWCVFGCGGDRDPGKRPLMAAVAERLADVAIVTDDNPRTESGDAIVADILRGFQDPSRVRVIRDRALAIRTALAQANESDVVLIAGKGHEDYQIYGTEQRDFSDRAIVLEAQGGA